MNIYKSLKLLILIGSGILLACSPKTTDKVIPNHPSESQAPQATQRTFQGLQAHKDPLTGKFVQMPAITAQPQNNNNNSVTPPPAVSVQNNNHKNSNIMLIPAPYRTNHSNANKN